MFGVLKTEFIAT